MAVAARRPEAAPITQSSPGAADLLTLGFGTTVAMWTVGYLGRMPGIMAHGALVAAGMLMALVVGGYLTGRHSGRGFIGGAVAGTITATLNLLIVLSLIRSDQTEHQAFSGLSLPGTVAGTALIMALAAAVGARFKVQRAEPVNWTCRFAVVASAATTLLLMAGGLVTGREAGLSVPDWPASFGYNMFLYPYARMTGNIYYEHTHRLYGALVGVTTIVLAIHLWMRDERKWLRGVAGVAVVAVMLQGVMGGLRVSLAETGSGIEVALPEHETTISAALRVAHGVFGQVFFGLLVLIAAFTSTSWRRGVALPTERAGAERWLSVVLVSTVVLQLTLGAMVRHLQMNVALHMCLAAVITMVALTAGVRAWGLYGSRLPVLRKAGITVISLMILQLVLGVAALVVVSLAVPGSPDTADAIITTAHQMNGAALLAASVVLAAFTFRLLEPVPAEVVSEWGAKAPG